MNYRIYYHELCLLNNVGTPHDVTLKLSDPTELVHKLEQHHGVDPDIVLIIDAIKPVQPTYRVELKFTGYGTVEVEAPSEASAEIRAFIKFREAHPHLTDLEARNLEINHTERTDS